MNKTEKMGFKIMKLEVSEDSLEWSLNIEAKEILNSVKRGYKMSLVINEEAFIDERNDVQERMEEIQSNPDMLGDWKGEVAKLKEELKKIEDHEKELKKKEVKEFVASVIKVDFSKDRITIAIPEEVIIGIITIRREIERYFLANLE